MASFNEGPSASLRLLKKKIRKRQTGQQGESKRQQTPKPAPGAAATAAAPSMTTLDTATDDIKFLTKPAVQWLCNHCKRACIPVRGESRCLCGHRYKQHKFDTNGKCKCSVRNCQCGQFFFVVAEGAWVLRCRCKHKHTDHDPAKWPHRCTKRGCECNGFTSPWVCNCGHKWTEHTQVTKLIKFVRVDGKEMPASLFAQIAGISVDTDAEAGGGIAPEINNVQRDPQFGERY